MDLNLEQNEEHLRRTVIQSLINLSRIDDEIHGHELLYLLDIGESLGFTPESVRAFIYEEHDEVTLPKAEKDRMTILYLMLFLMKIDGKVSEAEENLVFHYGFKLGFNEGMIREMLTIMKKYIGIAMPPNELLSTIKKYLN